MRSLAKKVYASSGKPKWVKSLYDSYKIRSAPLEKELQELFEVISAWCGGLSGKKLMDVGCDSGHVIINLHRLFGLSEVIGLNLIAKDTKLADNCWLKNGDIRKTNFPDSYFDVLVSFSAFEHIQNLDTALKEMFRILKPGGFLFSHFGPIWSTSYGHHLWLEHGGKTYNYWNVFLPPFAHLLMSKEKIIDSLAPKYPRKLREEIAEFVLNSPHQNKLFFSDYQKLFSESPFKVILFKGYDTDSLARKYNKEMTDEIFSALMRKFPDHNNFHYDGIMTLLKKS